MSKKGFLGVDLHEWNALAGLSDPYSLELAKISAEAGVPRAHQLEEGYAVKDHRSKEYQDRDPKKGRLALIKQSARRIQKGKNPDLLMKYQRNAEKKKAQEDIGYEDLFAEFLEDHGTSLDEFSFLLDYAVHNEDYDLQDELLAVEESFDGLVEAAGAAVGVAGKGLGLAGKVGAKLGGAAAKVGELGAKAMKPATNLMSKAASSYEKGKQAMDAVNKAKDAVSSGAPKADAPPAPTADAPEPSASPSQPGQTSSSGMPGAKTAGGDSAPQGKTTGQEVADALAKKDKKEPTGMKLLARGLGKLGKGAGGTVGGIVKKGAGDFKAGFKGESVDDADFVVEALAEHGLTPEEYMAVVEHAYDIGDDDMIEALQQLDEIFASWKKKKADEAAKKKAEVDAAWARARAGKEVAGSQERSRQGKDLTPAQKREMEMRLRQGGQKYYQKPPVQRIKKVNEAIDEQLRLSGYVDEYIEGRSKEQQYHGMKMQTAEPWQKERFKHHYRGDAKQLADKSAKRDKGNPEKWSGTKRLRSYGADHSSAPGDSVADDRAYLKKKNKDKLAKRASLSSRERRREMRKAARGHKSDAY